jgi:hypothetical protein
MPVRCSFLVQVEAVEGEEEEEEDSKAPLFLLLAAMGPWLWARFGTECGPGLRLELELRLGGDSLMSVLETTLLRVAALVLYAKRVRVQDAAPLHCVSIALLKSRSNIPQLQHSSRTGVS